jgi:hypothetical protein
MNMCNEKSYERLGGLKGYWVMHYNLESYAQEPIKNLAMFPQHC